MFEKQKAVGLDVETNGLCPHKDDLLSIQIGTESEQIIIYADELDNPAVRDPLQKLLMSKTVKIMHNAVFDIKMLWSVGLDIENVFDTLTAEKLCYSTLKPTHLDGSKNFYRLDWVLYRRLGVKFTEEKDIRLSFLELSPGDRFTEQQKNYALEDVKYMVPLARKIYKHLFKLGMAKKNSQYLYSTLGLENHFILVQAEKEYNGMFLDVNCDNWKQAIKKVDDMVELEKNMCETLAFRINPEINEINLNSPKQKLELLHKLDPNLESTSSEYLKDYLDLHPIIPRLIQYSKLSKLKNSFLKKLPKHINEVTGRLHTSYNIVSTGRLSSSKPALQQIPSKGDLAKLIRGSFVAKEGFDIVGGDYSQAEVRILAQASMDKKLIEAINSGIDLHSKIASMVYQIPLEKTKTNMPEKQITYRTASKMVTFGVPYGVTAANLAQRLQMEESEAKRILKDYYSAFPELKKFLDNVSYIGAYNGFMRTLPPFNRIRFFASGSSKASMGRQAKNHVPQGSNGDLTKLALVFMRKWIRKNNLQSKIKIIHSVHDEGLTEAKKDVSKMWKVKMQKLMLLAGKKIVNVVPMSVDCYVSNKWEK